ncbi:hypothetical protein F4808DRAFT_464229 [Astrocystis sublimbata]|nr:hypothetical protein F4808DRAFT_464222 [Astrocystis sublimbata]KAI0195529.1 hypothetical protein F4808DRAFT_464229 [Astrocystis sublimbata]
MSFVPAPQDLEAYLANGTTFRFNLGNLSRYIPRRYFEQALQGLPCGHGRVVVYWPKYSPRVTGEAHSGWCHLMCTEVEQKRELMNHLRETEFARIVRIQITGQPAAASTSTSTSTVAQPASPTATTAATIAPPTATNTPSAPAKTAQAETARSRQSDRLHEERTWCEENRRLGELYQEILDTTPGLSPLFKDLLRRSVRSSAIADHLWGNASNANPATASPQP